MAPHMSPLFPSENEKADKHSLRNSRGHEDANKLGCELADRFQLSACLPAGLSMESSGRSINLLKFPCIYIGESAHRSCARSILAQDPQATHRMEQLQLFGKKGRIRQLFC